jgi:hypothetical protein
MDPISIALIISALINVVLLNAWRKQRFVNIRKLDDLEDQLLCLVARGIREFNAKVEAQEKEKETERAYVD